MERHFRHLTRAEISEIIARHKGGETNVALAQEFRCDPSTISYHVTKFERSYPEEGGVYALIKVQMRKTCVHPSGRCNYCGDMWDGLMREERETIQKLTRELEDAKSRLRVAGLLME